MTKLTKAEKAELKLDKREYPNIEFFHFPEYRVTFAFERTSQNRGNIAWAICSETEDKYRKSVGEKMAMRRVFYGIVLPIEIVHEQQLADLAGTLTL